MSYYIYIVRCTDGSHYTGIAAHLCQRMREHVEKLPACARYTRSHPVTALDGLWRAADRASAARLEYAIKHLTKEKKLLLMAAPEKLGELLPRLADEAYEYLPNITLDMCLEGTFDDGN